MFLSDAEQKKALKALRKRLGITGEMPGTVGEINALPVGTFLLKHGNSLSNFVPAEKPIGFLRVDNAEKGWIVGVLGSGGGFRGPVDPSGILEVVPLTPTLLASMVDVGSRSTAHLPLPRSAGYGKADRKAWAYWVGAEILKDGSEARQALKDAIETMGGSEVKIGDITWSPGQNIHVEFEEAGKKPRSMGFLKNGSNPMTYKIEVKKNGQRYGEFGPYKRKSDADADAKELRRLGSGVRVSVVQGKPVDLSYLESIPISDQTPFERSLMGMLRAEDYSRYGWEEDWRGRGKGYTRQDAAIALGYAMAGGGDFWDLVKYYRRQYDGDIYGDAEGIVAERIGRMIRAGVISARAEDGGYGMMIDAIRSNPGHQWIQGVQEKIEEDGTAGRFTAQARRAGYKDTMAFAEKIMHEWRAGRERVWNKREKRWQKVTTMTMRRANYLLNTRQRRNG